MRTLLLVLSILLGGLVGANILAEEPAGNQHEFKWVSDDGLSGTGKTYLINKAFRIARRQINVMATDGKIKFESTHKVTIVWKGKIFTRQITARALEKIK